MAIALLAFSHVIRALVHPRRPIPASEEMTHTQPAHDPDNRSRALSARPTPSLERMHLETALRAAVVAPQLAAVLGPFEQQQLPDAAAAARAPNPHTCCKSNVPRGTDCACNAASNTAGQRDADHTRARRCTKPCTDKRGHRGDGRSSCAARPERHVSRERHCACQHARWAAEPATRSSGQQALSPAKRYCFWTNCREIRKDGKKRPLMAR